MEMGYEHVQQGHAYHVFLYVELECEVVWPYPSHPFWGISPPLLTDRSLYKQPIEKD